MIYSLFYHHNSSCTVFWVSSFRFSVKHCGVVPIDGPWSRMSKPSHLKLKCEVSRTEKGSRLRLCFRVVDDVSEKKGMDLWKQMSSSKCSFTCICGIFVPLNPSTTTVYAWSAFYPRLRFTLSLQSAFYTQSAFYPWSAVCSLQSASYTDRNENNCRTATGKPAFSAVMQSMSRHVILPRAFGKEGRNSSMLCAKTFMK